MTLWITLAVMSLVAIGFAVWPLYKSGKGFSPLVGGAIVLVVVLSAGLYNFQGSPAQPSGGGALPEMDAAVAALAQRLESNPNDVNGWKMLGRSYMTVGNYAGAVQAYEKAVDLESAGDAQSLVSLGEARLAASGAGVSGEVAALFESALAIDPNNPQGLFYGGIGAFNRNDVDLAADRWEQLLELNPPAEIQGILQQRVAEWRGLEAPVVEDTAQETVQARVEPPAPEQAELVALPDVVVTARLTVGDAAVAALPAEATIFVIARDAAAPGPPIAVVRRRLSELPVTIGLGDRESMVAGRSLSSFAEFELLARVSLSGQPTAQSGDWYGSEIVKPDENNVVELSINEQVQ
ncbi:MAG: tetratricopeptide repeat protein [Gammaproteobacteria bacterium]|nr:tetratricopeptide repeat protein [Gammaproteobacteria bacterium]